MNDYLDKAGLTTYDGKIKSYINGVSGNANGVSVTTLNEAPSTTTLQGYKVGDMVRVADANSDTGYTFYMLYDIDNGEAVWGTIGNAIDDTACIVINVQNNQNANINPTVTLSYTYDGEPVTDSQTGTDILFEDIPAGIQYTISFGSVSGYATPSNITGQSADFGRVGYTVWYNAELVTVTTNIENATVTINNVSYTGPILIPYGTEYVVKGDTVAGYVCAYDTYTAQNPSRTVAVQYNQMPIGVFIHTTDNSLITSSNWSTQGQGKTINGIAILSDSVQVVMAHDCDVETAMMAYSDMNKSCGLVAESENPIANTNRLKNVYGSGYAAGIVYNYIFKNGKHGYLGTKAQWNAIGANVQSILDCISAVSGTKFASAWGNGYADYWTSCYRLNNGVGEIFYNASFYPDYRYTGTSSGYGSTVERVRPLCDFY